MAAMPAPPRTTVRAAWRLVIGLGAAAGALVSGAVVGRALGPEGKGVVSTLSFLVTLAVPIAGLGLGEAGVALVRGRGVDLGRLAHLVVVTVTPVALAVAAVAGAAGWALVGPTAPVLLAAVAVPPAAVAAALAHLLEATRPLAATAVARAAGPLVAAVATTALVGFGTGGEAAALASVIVGSVVSLVVIGTVARRVGARARSASFDRGMLRSALQLGVPAQVTAVLVTASSRLDLVVVNAVAGHAEAGIYSVAATIGTMVAYAPGALTGASLADVADAPGLVASALHRATVLATASAVALAAVVPIGVPLVFGEPFRAAVTPSVIVLGAGVLAAVQQSLTRLLVASGRAEGIVRSHVASVASMIALDLVFVPRHGAAGAAWASVAAGAVGVVLLSRAGGQAP